MNKRGQLAIFVIVAIVIVAIVVIFFAFPQVNVFTTDVNPSSFLRECIEDDVLEVKEVLSTQGGYVNPSNYVLHEGEMIQYLCYTDQNYEPCIVQQPLLVGHVKQEISDFVTPRARACMNNLVEEYESKGFNVDSTPGDIEVEIIPGSIIVDFLAPLSVSKESTQTFQRFAIGIESEWYDLLLIATSIIEFESTLGDSETTLYLQYYPDLRIDKLKKNGDTIYTLSNVVTGEEFTFAVRSLVWPPGIGEVQAL